MSDIHWQVTNQTYPNGETVTEFEFGNGVKIQYDPAVGGLYLYLPEPEAVLSMARTTELVSNRSCFVTLDRIDGVLCGIEVVRPEADS